MTEVDFGKLGPAIGERFPAVVLPTAGGNLLDLHGDRAGRAALVVFYRSAHW